jgi:hypothetical protein
MQCNVLCCVAVDLRLLVPLQTPSSRPADVPRLLPASAAGGTLASRLRLSTAPVGVAGQASNATASPVHQLQQNHSVRRRSYHILVSVGMHETLCVLLIDWFSQSSKAAPLTIHFHPDEHQEVMLGSLLKQRQQVAGKEEAAAPGETCGRAHHLSLQMKESVSPAHF